MKAKLCGFTNKESLQVAIEQKCDFVGFVFCKDSPRYITPKDSSNLALSIPSTIAKVAVVVDAEFDFLTEISQTLHPDFFQFHGAENIQYLQKVRQQFPEIKIIKAFKISSSQDLAAIKDFENYADLFLFDAKSPGSGTSFDWKILQNFSHKKEWFLSGGLNSQNIDEALEITKAKMIDISSGLEEIRGVKSSKLIIEFMQKLRKICL